MPASTSTHLFTRGALIICALRPRFEFVCAAGTRTDLLGVPAVVSPEPGSRLIGAVSAAAEGFGIAAGMRLGEALARCPQLTLVPPDPAGVADGFERMLLALESIGARVEPLRPGAACFDARGLLKLHNSDLMTIITAARRALDAPVRFGVAPSRFAAVAAAGRARTRKPLIVMGGAQQARAFLAPMPVELLQEDPELACLVEPFTRLGIRTLGELAALPRAAMADRFGAGGLRAHQLARGSDTPLRPRDPGELIRESLELPDACGGIQLERALGLLIDRLLARGECHGRTVRAVVLAAVLVERGGTWRQRMIFREATADPLRMRLALVPRLQTVPAPAQTLLLTVERFGPPASDQQALFKEPARLRAGRLREAVRQARLVAGPDAALKVLEVDPESRFAERRTVLTPFEL
ncbi:MAG: hypothetical protein ACP5H2_10355 [Solirubrobacteraceae bacterium]